MYATYMPSKTKPCHFWDFFMISAGTRATVPTTKQATKSTTAVVAIGSAIPDTSAQSGIIKVKSITFAPIILPADNADSYADNSFANTNPSCYFTTVINK